MINSEQDIELVTLTCNVVNSLSVAEQHLSTANMIIEEIKEEISKLRNMDMPEMVKALQLNSLNGLIERTEAEQRKANENIDRLNNQYSELVKKVRARGVTEEVKVALSVAKDDMEDQVREDSRNLDLADSDEDKSKAKLSIENTKVAIDTFNACIDFLDDLDFVSSSPGK